MRLVLAIELESATAAALYAAAEPLRMAAPAVTWTPAERWRVILRGDDDVAHYAAVDDAGDVEPRIATRLVAALDRAALAHRHFAMRLSGFEAFPSFRRARVIRCGVEPDARLELLHHDLEVACMEAGLGAAGRPFRPHVEVGRVLTPMELPDARLLARAARRVACMATQDVSVITLFDAGPAATGERDRPMHRATLGGR